MPAVNQTLWIRVGSLGNARLPELGIWEGLSTQLALDNGSSGVSGS